MNRRDRQPAPVVTLGERLIAALLTPLVFNASVIIVVAMASRRLHYMFFNLTRVYHALGSGAILLLVAPAIVGFVAGFDGTVKIFGHAFWTHHDHERNWLTTALQTHGSASAISDDSQEQEQCPQSTRSQHQPDQRSRPPAQTQ